MQDDEKKYTYEIGKQTIAENKDHNDENQDNVWVRLNPNIIIWEFVAEHDKTRKERLKAFKSLSEIKDAFNTSDIYKNYLFRTYQQTSLIMKESDKGEWSRIPDALYDELDIRKSAIKDEKTGSPIIKGSLLLLMSVLLIGFSDEIHWNWASYKNDTSFYGSYVRSWPEGRHIKEAKSIYEELGWADAISENTVQGYKKYINVHIDGSNVTEAKKRIDQLYWAEASKSGTKDDYLKYIELNENGDYVLEAKDEIEWAGTLSNNTIRSYSEYSNSFPNGKYRDTAISRIKELEKEFEKFKKNNPGAKLEGVQNSVSV